MKRPGSILIFFILLVMGLSLTVPVEDVPETPYDESEPLPYEGTPLVSDMTPQAAASATHAVPRARVGQLAAPFSGAAMRINRRDADQPAAPVALALLCILLC